MGLYTEKKSITQSEYLQLLGLRLISKDAVNDLNRITKVVAEILGEDGENGLAGDFAYSADTFTVEDLLKRSEITVDKE